MALVLPLRRVACLSLRIELAFWIKGNCLFQAYFFSVAVNVISTFGSFCSGIVLAHGFGNPFFVRFLVIRVALSCV